MVVVNLVNKQGRLILGMWDDEGELKATVTQPAAGTLPEADRSADETKAEAQAWLAARDDYNEPWGKAYGIIRDLLAALEDEKEWRPLYKKRFAGLPQATTIWVCDNCGFGFDADHHDGPDPDTEPRTYTCPLCAEVRLEKELTKAKAVLALLPENQVLAARESLRGNSG